MANLEKLPEELQGKIFEMVFSCKKNQSFYINKELTNFILSKNLKCKSIKCLGKHICQHCHKYILKFFTHIPAALI